MSDLREYALPLGGALGLVVLGWWIFAAPASSPSAGSKTAPTTAATRAVGAVGGDGGGVDAQRGDGRSLSAGSLDPSVSASEVAGRIEDPDGLPITQGRVRLRCAAGEVAAAGIVEVDDDGMFQGTGCAGITCAEFVHPSMIQTGPWILSAGRPEVFTARALRREGGVVVDADGEPIAAARIVLEMPAASGDGSAPDTFTTRNTVSDAAGSFSFALVERPPCDPCRQAAGRCVDDRSGTRPSAGPPFSVLASAPGFKSSSQQVSLGEEPWRIVLEVSTEVIRGQLVDEDGQPYPRAKILARASERPAEIHQATVDGADFELVDLGEGPYELRAIQDGIELATASDVAAGEEVELRGGLPALGVTLTLRIDDADGDAVAGAVVDGGPFIGAEADEHGELRALYVLPGAYSLRVRTADRSAQRHPLMISDGEARIDARIKLLPE